MNRHEDINQLPKAAVFAEVIRSGSFGRAAAALGMSPSTVSHHIRSLETALGVRLLERTTRRMRLTQEGTLIYERMNVALTAWTDAVSAVGESRREPKGVLRLTAPSGLCSVIAKAGGAFLRKHPRVGIDLITDDQSLDLVSRGIDVAVRMAPMADTALLAKKMGDTPMILVASPALAASMGSSSRDIEEALARLGYVAHAALPHDHMELFREGTRRRVAVQPRVRVNSLETQVAFVEAGAGITLIPALLIHDAIRGGRLVRVLSDWCGRERPIYAVHAAHQLMPARVSRFLPVLKTHLSEELNPGPASKRPRATR